MGKKRIKNKRLAKTGLSWDVWVAQLVEHRTLDFALDHDLVFRGMEPCVGGMKPVGILSIPISLTLPHILFLPK